VPTLSELIPDAGDRAGWKVDRITQACFGAQTGVAAVPILFVRAADHTAGAAQVLDLCLPLAQAVEDHAVRELTFTNGAGAQIVTAAWFADYEGADGSRYLGAFVRVPIPPMFLDARPIGDLLKVAVEQLWTASMMFGRYIEFCQDNSTPPGCEPLRGREVVAARPADPFDVADEAGAKDD
jgi:hypothetical protein